MGQCPDGAFQNMEAASQDDDPVIRKQTSQSGSAVRPKGGKTLPETPDKEEEYERSRRGEETGDGSSRRLTAQFIPLKMEVGDFWILELTVNGSNILIFVIHSDF
ncbi:hypothetical protein NDU88_003095 [Pleurodeles waltl]|uniref:Uncharacterized protein n=1 Tax=Pleurodeles waltl TaxID=8319 RepID=A0AAV7M4D6_PLEWA|nr:hypothetical protein NDU88_003095 [Pleurodeles waltl]